MISRLIDAARWPHIRLAAIATVAVLNVAGVIYYGFFLHHSGYLPSPFLYDKSDTFMDLYNPMYWAYDDGRYTEWRSVYPPVNFLFLQFANFVFGSGWSGGPFFLRADSPSVAAGFVVISIALPAAMLALKPWNGLPKGEKLLMYLALVSSAPMLFALERGNLVALCPILLASVLYRGEMARSIFIAILINIKPYFAVLLVYHLVRKDWKGFVSCTIASGAIFLVSGLLLDGHFLVFLVNLFGFSQEEGLFTLREVMAMPSSVSAISYVLRNPDGMAIASQYFNESILTLVAVSIEVVKWAVIATSMTLLMFRARFMQDGEIISLLVVALTNLGVWVGGYTLVLYIALVPCLAGMRYRGLYLALLACIAVPLDWISLAATQPGWLYSYLSDSYVWVEWSLSLGSLARPSINLLLLAMLCYELLARGPVFRRVNEDEKTSFHFVHGS